MQALSNVIEKIFSTDEKSFEEVVWEVFGFQYQHNPVYKAFADHLKKTPSTIKEIQEIPFLPVEIFKNHTVLCNGFPVERYFESSGTTTSTTSKHPVASLAIYEKSILEGFKNSYGHPDEWIIIGLLPSYAERDNASLIYMVDYLMRQSGSPHNAFFLYNYEALAEQLVLLRQQSKKVLLIGVTFALLDFAAKHPMDLSHVTIMETGGMKGKRKEITREEVQSMLREAFETAIHSEYGMTELLSQSYAKENGIFSCPPWMKVLKRDIYDPLDINTLPGRGCINVIDLANLYSCSFLATQDIGLWHSTNQFEVLGRIDNSDIRGCNLMMSI